MECRTCEELMFYDECDECWRMRIENSNWDDYNDCFDYTDIRINFCPECGRDYRVNKI